MNHISNNTYPGRGIVVGLNENSERVIVYWIMGRSANSRNRILEYKDNIVSTKPKDYTKVEDPSLIVYNAMRDIEIYHQSASYTIITNGSQTDTIVEQLRHGRNFIESLSGPTDEPVAPNFKPRIRALVDE